MPQVITDATLLGNKLHEWTFPEYQKHERGQVWHILMISLGLILLIYAMVSGNFLFALVVILVGIILFLQAKQPPVDVTFQITELGIVVGNRFYPYTEFHDFYILYDPPEIKMLFLETKSLFRPTLRVPLEDVNPVDVRQTLRRSLTEDVEQEEEPLSEKVGRWWKIQ